LNYCPLCKIKCGSILFNGHEPKASPLSPIQNLRQTVVWLEY